MPNISPLGDAIHGDFYSISGTRIPANVQIEFATSSGVVSVTPSIVRPHLVFVAQLPNTIPLGRNTVRLRSPSWNSDTVSVKVFAGQPKLIRVIYPGRPVTRPYTIAFIANPAVEAATGGTFSADPVLLNPPAYHLAIDFCLRNLFTVTEDLLIEGDLDAHIRIVSLFLPHLQANAANALTREDSVAGSTTMQAKRDDILPFLSRYSETADVTFVVYDSATFSRSSAYRTTDDMTQATTGFTYDGANYTHAHFARIPGAIAFYVFSSTSGMTPLHEFGHAASSYNGGGLLDLYVDGTSSALDINKKFRAAAGAAIPAQFGTYNGMNYSSDATRDGIGYPATWSSYHPALINPGSPNVMDNYWLAAAPQQCRFDALTRTWFRDRIREKVFR